MSEEEFLNLGKYILICMQNINIDPVYNRELNNKLRKLKEYIYDNKESNIVKFFIDEFLNQYLALLLNSNLAVALNIDKPFYRQLEVYKYLPHNIHPTIFNYLFDILELKSFPHYYEGIFEALKIYKPEYMQNITIIKLRSFINENKNIMRGSKDTYGTLEEEKHKYFHIDSKEFEAEINAYANANYIMDKEQIKEELRRKSIGNIGELHVYDRVKNNPNCCLVARDVKNGFGYDIYYLYNNQIEILLEVKTTTLKREIDRINVSENEYNYMLKCLNNPSACYRIIRVTLDSNLNLESSHELALINEDTLIDIQDQNTRYKKDGNYFIKVVPQKEKKIEQI